MNQRAKELGCTQTHFINSSGFPDNQSSAWDIYLMIREAMKGERPANLTFEVADATALPYADASFDAVLIANALHVMPEPEKALNEIDRVLRPGGVLIAPNFVEHRGGFMSRVWSGILKIAGIRFEHQ